ncbi:hypothetical protein F2P81_017682 [Scophthalmus maximus]|uniref:Uncharacterized protein n=1 Tax=Scophthalmus maximus TaxID=52904 RepID=A0A6A4SIJ1_SCOMX|nr:hypothetical protein F2P81_017682 [Scophthalmus maximus]
MKPDEIPPSFETMNKTSDEQKQKATWNSSVCRLSGRRTDENPSSSDSEKCNGAAVQVWIPNLETLDEIDSVRVGRNDVTHSDMAT